MSGQHREQGCSDPRMAKEEQGDNVGAGLSIHGTIQITLAHWGPSGTCAGGVTWFVSDRMLQLQAWKYHSLAENVDHRQLC